MTRTYFPHEIVELWQSEIKDVPSWFEEILLDYAPPVSTDALEIVQAWIGEATLDSRLRDLRTQDIQKKFPKSLYVAYPLFGSHLRLSEHDEHRGGAREALIQAVGGRRVPIDPETTQADRYYQDCLGVRKALLHVLRTDFGDRSPGEVLLQELNLPGGIPSLSPHEQSRCLKLLQGDRLPGVPSHKRVTDHDPRHIQRVRSVSILEDDRHQFPPIGDEAPASGEPQAPPLPEYHRIGSGEVTSRTGHESEPSDPDEPDLYRRRTADFRSRGDDRHMLAELPWLQSVRETRSPADIYRLPLAHVVEAIRGLRQRKKYKEWVFTWLLATTAIPVDRLAKLSVHESAPDLPEDEEALHVNLLECRLEVSLSDGPSGPLGSSSRVARTPLPSTIIEALSSFGTMQPFLQSAGYADHTLRRHFRSFPGLTPTCRRIRATAEAVIHGLAPDSITALALKGQFGHAARGAAAYRQTFDPELADLYRRVCQSWKDHNLMPGLANIDAFPVPAVNLTIRPSNYVGSRRVAALSRFQEAFEYLRKQIDLAVNATHRQKGTAGVDSRTVLDLQHAHARLSYLALLLSTGIRPISTRAQVRLVGNYWFVQDKDSPDFSERRAIPALPEIVDQVLGQQAFTRGLCQTVPLRRLSFVDATKDESDIPVWLEPTGKGMRLRRMKQSDFRVIADLFGLDTRASRHTFATVLRPLVSETELNAMLGHSGGGWQRESLMSMGEARYTQRTWQAIRQMVQEAGFHPINPQYTYAK